MRTAETLAALTRGCVECHSREDLKRKLESGRPLRVKLGVDPTSPDLHLGHTVVLNRLRAFQDEGHTAVLIIGDFTARVGDPSGRDSTRPALSEDQIKANAQTYKDQAMKVLDASRTETRWNSEWLEPFIAKELFQVLRRYTVGQLLQREDFSIRSKAGLPITLLEILYPLLQGYDSVAVKADVELGGSDQLFNLLMGRTLQKDRGQEPQVAMTFPLLVGLDGVKKMSKSYGNAISLTESARDMFGKVMSVSDELMRVYFELLTRRDIGEVKAMHPLEAKKSLAEELTARFHGAAAAAEERAFFENTFSKKARPNDVPLMDVKGASKLFWSQILVNLGLTESRKEAQRLISQGAVRKDDVPIVKDAPIGDAAGNGDHECLLKVGKHKFLKVRFLK